jgi:hypothetical protein
MFSSIQGLGVFLNGNKCQVQSAVTEKSDAIVNARCLANPKAFEVSMRGMVASNSNKAWGI